MSEIDTLLAGLQRRVSEVPRRWAQKAPEAPAIREGELAWSYRELQLAIEEATAFLRDHGVRAGDRVMIVGENCALGVACLFATAALDAWAVNVNARLSPREIDVIREHCGARRVLYTFGVSVDAAAHGARQGAVEVAVGRAGRALLGPLNEDCRPEPLETASAAQVATLIYTSGTTGQPKGVMLTHRNLLFIAAVSSQLRSLVPADRVYGVLPFSHVYGLASVMIGSLYAGCCLHVVPQYSAERLANALAHDGITVYQGVPAMYTRLLDRLKSATPPATHVEAPDLRFIYAGGSPLDATLKAEAEAAFGMTLHNGYGMTESSPTISQTRFDAPRADTSVGPPIPGVAVRVVDANGLDVAPGMPGELWVRGPNVMKGYYRDAELTAQVLDADGWLNTGDLARQDPDGALFIVGRTKDLIIRSGFNVYPVEVEAVLNSHPAVAQASVVGREVAAGNEEVIAFVERVPGAQTDEQALLDHAAAQLSPYKRPSRIVFVAALPAAATGKILKNRLKQMARELDSESPEASSNPGGVK